MSYESRSGLGDKLATKDAAGDAGALFPTKEELKSWEALERERGGDVEAIGEFVYGPDENPWLRKNYP